MLSGARVSGAGVEGVPPRPIRRAGGALLVTCSEPIATDESSGAAQEDDRAERA